MIDIDVQTLFALFFLGNIITSLFFSIYIYLYQVKKQRLNLYVLAKVLQSIAWYLFMSRSSFPGNFPIITANIFLLFGLAFEVYTLLTINLKKSKNRKIILGLFSLIYSIVFILIVDSPAYLRVSVMSFFLSSFFAFVLFEFWFWKKRTKMEYVAASLDLIIAVLFIIRGSCALFNRENASLYNQNTSQVLTYIGFFMITYTWPIIFLFLLKEKDEYQLLENRQKIEKDNLVLKELSASKDKLFSIIGHDLRSPFTSILGFTEIIHEKSKSIDNKEIEEYSSIVYNSAQQSLNLLNNLLQWTKLQSNRIVLKPEMINFNKTIHSILNLLEASFESKELTVIKLVKPNFEFVADRLMLETILRNLLTNAIKYTPNKGRITIIVIKIQSNVKIQIKDTGVGISDENKKKIFKIENNFTTSGTNNEKGTGLGLILCQEFIKKQNGELVIESTEGKGSVFTILLPQTSMVR